MKSSRFVKTERISKRLFVGVSLLVLVDIVMLNVVSYVMKDIEQTFQPIETVISK